MLKQNIRRRDKYWGKNVVILVNIFQDIRYVYVLRSYKRRKDCWFVDWNSLQLANTEKKVRNNMLPQISQWKSFISGKGGSNFFRNIATYLPNYKLFQKNHILEINLSESFKSQKWPKFTEVKNN